MAFDALSLFMHVMSSFLACFVKNCVLKLWAGKRGPICDGKLELVKSGFLAHLLVGQTLPDWVGHSQPHALWPSYT